MLFHDATTFALGDTETDLLETIHELSGRSDRRVGGKDGLGSFLSSLPEQVRELFHILVMQQRFHSWRAVTWDKRKTSLRRQGLKKLRTPGTFW